MVLRLIFFKILFEFFKFIIFKICIVLKIDTKFALSQVFFYHMDFCSKCKKFNRNKIL